MEALSPGGDLQAYINSVHSIGILTSEEEKKSHTANSFTSFQSVILFTAIKTMQKIFPTFFTVFFALEVAGL